MRIRYYEAISVQCTRTWTVLAAPERFSSWVAAYNHARRYSLQRDEPWTVGCDAPDHYTIWWDTAWCGGVRGSLVDPDA